MSAPESGRRVALISCGKAKLDRAAPARDLYTSNLFRLSVAWAEQYCDAWYVLSARHGLLDPAQLVEPYEYSLAQMRSERERDAWCDRVIGSLARRERQADVVLLAGGQYRRIASKLRWSLHPAVTYHPGTAVSIVEPLEGLGIGQRLHWLKHEGSTQR